ncbi:MAG: 5-formyltetrahydrofolate cyclo-ligase [Clostridiales bacterium]|nr:5-formyltetrahydrofolate cyclo-ligase [Clostridiales bacterium]
MNKSENKKLLRKKMLGVRAQIADRARKDAAIAERLTAFLDEGGYKKIFFYVSIGSEVDTKRILAYYYGKPGIELFVPRTDEDMRPVRLPSVGALTADKRGNLLAGADAVPYTGKPDAVIVPLAAFNTRLYRLGYGGGYYDKYLSGPSAVSVGLAYDEQFADTAFEENFDVPLNYIITPTRILRRFTDAENKE